MKNVRFPSRPLARYWSRLHRSACADQTSTDYETGRIGDFVVREPLILGHEASGTVIGVGTDATGHTIGDRVAIEPGVPCGRCRQCRSGRYNLCRDIRFLATPPVDGALTSCLTIDENFAHTVPDTLSFEAAALLEPLSVGIWANHKAGTTIGSNVLITGAGPIGILSALVAQAAGAEVVTVLDINAERLDQARALGVRDTINGSADTGALEADILIECTGVESVTYRGIGTLRQAGTAVLVGMSSAPDQNLPTALIQSRELTVTGTFRYANTYPQAIALASSGRVRLDDLVGRKLPLAETEQALQMSRTQPSVLKTLVTVAGA